MTTKDDFLLLKPPSFSNNNCFNGHNTQQQQYSNLNLNQGYCNSDVSVVQSYSKSNNSSSNKHFDPTSTLTYESTKKSQIWNKSNNLYSSNLLNHFEGNKDEAKKSWKNVKSSFNSKNSSTLSLHIAAYENSIEASSDGSFDERKSSTTMKQENLIKKQKDVKQIHSMPFIQNPFEFPRQQESNQTTTTDPEVMQFKASQRLLNFNETNNATNQQSNETIINDEVVDDNNTVHERLPMQLFSLQESMSNNTGLYEYERKKFFEPGEYYEIIDTTNNPFGGTTYYFEDNALVLNVTETNIVLIRPTEDFNSENESIEPFFEICGEVKAVLPPECEHDRLNICYSSAEPIEDPQVESCRDPAAGLRSIRIEKNNLYFNGRRAALTEGNSCRKFYQKRTIVHDKTEYYLTNSPTGPFNFKLLPQIEMHPLPYNDKLLQTRLRIFGTHCGLQLRFPNSMIAIKAPPPTTTPSPIPTTTLPPPAPTPIPYEPTTKLVIKPSNTETQESSPILLIGIIFGSIAFLLIVCIIVGFVIRYFIKKRKQKTKTIPLIPKDDRSLESIVCPMPAQPPSSEAVTVPASGAAASEIPYMDPALEDKTQELSLPSLTPQTQATQPTTVPGGKPQDQLVKKGGSKQSKEHLPGDGKEGIAGAAVAAAAGGSKDDKESDSSEIPLPALAVDTTKKYTKLFKEDFDRGQEDSIASEENCGENIYKLEAFCMANIPLPDVTMATWPPDYVVNMAIRAPNIVHRASFLYQAIIMANNLLLKKGIKNNKGALTGSPKAMKWLKTRSNIPFVQFISECVENATDGSGQEFLSSKIQWRRYLKKIDVVETFRQSCWLGQTKERREFFLLATFYKMELLTKQFPSEDDLKSFPFPVPMLLEVRKEAPQFFEILQEEKLPGTEKKGAGSGRGGGGGGGSGQGGALSTSQTPQIPKFSN